MKGGYRLVRRMVIAWTCETQGTRRIDTPWSSHTTLQGGGPFFRNVQYPYVSRPRHVTNSGFGKARGRTAVVSRFSRLVIDRPLKPITFLTLFSQKRECLCFQHVVHATHPIPRHPVDAHNRCLAPPPRKYTALALPNPTPTWFF